jgi:preprotein translocase subunit SecB
MLSPLQLKQIYFTSIRLDQQEGSVDAPIRVRTKIEGAEDKANARILNIRLNVTVDGDPETPLAYTGDFTVVGQFEVAESYDVTRHIDVMRVNAVSLLYGTVREMIMTLSARSAPGLLCLPTLSFTDLPKRLAEEDAPAPARKNP